MNYTKKIYTLFMTTLLLLVSQLGWSAETVTAPSTNNASLDSGTILRYALGGVIILFVFIIIVLANAIKVAASNYQQRIREQRSHGGKTLGMLLILIGAPQLLMAQAAQAAETGGMMKSIMNNWDAYLLMLIIVILFITVIIMVRTLFVLMGIKEASKAEKEAAGIKVKTFFQRFNETVAIEEEDKLDLSHNYDGIRELDNKVPSWWMWAFYACIAFGFVYLYQMFVSERIPSQYKELATEYKVAEKQKLAYLEKSASNIDEKNVVALKGDDLSQGGKLYAQNCLACHGDKGQGGIGPNLTDKFWIHKGGLSDIFYSIKYGWQEKGMKAWKDDLSPLQIAQVSSYVVTLQGSNPPGAKEAQGDEYIPEAIASKDSSSATAAPKDSVK